ncbi:D-alanyl-D-alanine carboxypeptidase family protein [Microbacterium sp. Marseille-Q6965]|uniref:D-alanyl-D-alanine carboxypeptidase family protein n=1 Tax=Microbacterium sp. Marseille-Q6965 TaxID=2965072 RepID=UPI0021B8279A|nr:D-alanyl-D-alanine carboxypeptidase [Microbacterium sp. Marseille-Q6965]
MTPDDLPRATSAAELSPEPGPHESRPSQPSRRALREARQREARARQNAATAAAPPVSAAPAAATEAPARPTKRGPFGNRPAKPAAAAAMRDGMSSRAADRQDPAPTAVMEPGSGPSDAAPLPAPPVAARRVAADDLTALVPAPTGPDVAPSPALNEEDPVTVPADAPAPAPRALTWADPHAVSQRSATAAFSTAPHRAVTGPDLLPPRRRGALTTLAPAATLGALAVAYVGTCVLWPLDAVAPEVSAQQVAVAPGAPLAVSWPVEGSAAIAPVGMIDSAAADSSASLPIASITKLVSVLMILDKQPLAQGEQGPSYAFTWQDYRDYLDNYLWAGQSSLDVPVDGSLTQYQMLEGILMGSANNYVNRLVAEIWGSNEAFAAEAAEWLAAHGLEHTTIVEPSGMDPANTATASDVLLLGQLALEHPVVAEIVAKPTTTLPGNEEPVENSNPLLGEEGIVGIKTGTLDEWNLVSAKRIDAGGETVTVVAAVLGQPDADTRTNVSRDLLNAATASLQPTTVVPADTVVASVRTEWGTKADVVTVEDTSLVLWNGAVAPVEQRIDDVLGELSGGTVGELTATGSFGTQTVELELTDDIGVPSLGWRLTHPLDLLGLR